MAGLGTIIGIEENTVLLKLNENQEIKKSLIGLYIVFKDEERVMVGEVSNIKDGIMYINLLGEIKNNQFVFGAIHKPSLSAVATLLPEKLIPAVVSSTTYSEGTDLYLGRSSVYQNVKVSIKINQFFSHHFALFGSSGSGKSCSLARIIQNIFIKKDPIPYRASIFIFDAYGEYHSAFSKINDSFPELNFKSYTTKQQFGDTDLLRIPLWLLDVDDIALLLGAEKPSQLPIIEKALKLVTIFGKEESLVIKHKNDIIARAIMDILSTGNTPGQIRDQITSVLSQYNTKELNLDSVISQPGYSRPLKQCLFIDASGKIRDIELVTTFIQKFMTEDLELELPDGSFQYSLDDLKKAFDFALISEGVLTSEKVFDDVNVLKVRLHTLVNSESKNYFSYDHFVDRDQYIRELLTANNGKKAQIVNFNINYVDDRLAKNIVKIYSKLLFDYAKAMDKKATMPFHLILEEAHRYVQNDNDINLLGYNIFERITKEGRKYGVLLGLISQRPSELSETVLSQCNNFLIFKMLHPRDVDYIKEMVPNITNEIVKKLRILQPGTCIAFGAAFKVPIVIEFDMPNPAPTSSSCDVSGIWFVRKQSQATEDIIR